jgi:hypothetical protein
MAEDAAKDHPSGRVDNEKTEQETEEEKKFCEFPHLLN